MESTKFTNLEANEDTHVNGLTLSVSEIETAVSVSLTAAQLLSTVLLVEATAGSKVLTLGAADGKAFIIKNVGATNTFSVKNQAADAGTSLTSGSGAIFICSTTTDASTVLSFA